MDKFIICFEGIDGAGKHTQAELLMKALDSKGIKAKIYSYPDYASDYGKIVSGYLSNKRDVSVEELFLLFLAEKVKDNDKLSEDLAKSTVVIVDRYFYSNIAYQCAAGFSYENAKQITGMLKWHLPSVVLYIDVPPELSTKRKMEQKHSLDRNEKNMKYLKEVRLYYDKLAAENYSDVEWIKIDGTKPIGEVHKKVLEALKKIDLGVLI